MNSEKLDRLPKWAQRRIGVLESDVDYWRRVALAGPEESNTSARHGTTEKPLGVGVRIRFQIGERDYIDACLRDGRLDVVGSDSIVVRPAVSNHVVLEVETS